ncbi:MAG TPA: SDR family oxidoreductase [Pirellulales bacterium]|jgi:nucleoside-diphosphate-sugar epimerase|nr:SDR family oxidoreductase [Pirellulales bacterium]
MRVLVTGCHGYIGSVLVPMLLGEGHLVHGIDSNWFEPCALFPAASEAPSTTIDLRDVRAGDVEGFDAVIHLAALSNDPLSNLDPGLTFQINHLAAVRLAKLARRARVERFLVSSSCSMYGSAGETVLTEAAELQPITPYGQSKVLADREIALLANDDFSPIFLRNATAYGVSPRLRLDLVLNDFVAAACTSGQIVIRSDGTPWRPVVHVEDICLAFLAALDAPREAVHNEAINVGNTDENYRVSELAEIVTEVVPGSRVEYAPGGGPDKRCYRVDCSKLGRVLPHYRPRWNVHRGAAQLADAYRRHGLTTDDIESGKFLRLRRLRELLDERRLTADLRWQATGQTTAAEEAAHRDGRQVRLGS